MVSVREKQKDNEGEREEGLQLQQRGIRGDFQGEKEKRNGQEMERSTHLMSFSKKEMVDVEKIGVN